MIFENAMCSLAGGYCVSDEYKELSASLTARNITCFRFYLQAQGFLDKLRGG